MMLEFLTDEVPFFSCLSNIFLFLTQIRKKYAICVISTKNKIICDTK